MALGFIPINGPIEANTTYVDNSLAGKNLTFSNPEISAITAEVEAMGTMTLPLWSRLENMEANITKIGQDANYGKLIEPKMKTIEHRWIQSQIDANGNVKSIGCKVFWRCIPINVPAIEVTTGESVEGQITYTVTRYNLIVDGKEIVLVDRLTGTVKINGKDYSSGAKNML